jgi:hypothetical protein
VLATAPSVVELPWMRVELVTETGKICVFALAVHKGWIVATAPIAKKLYGQSAREAWKLFRSRGAKLMRMDPPGSKDGRA